MSAHTSSAASSSYPNGSASTTAMGSPTNRTRRRSESSGLRASAVMRDTSARHEQRRSGPWSRRVASTLRNGGLRKLFGAEVISGAGDGIFWVSLVVFLADQPRFGLWLTLAVIARLAPRAFLSLPAGSLVDRRNLRSLVVSIEFIRAGLMVGPAAIVPTVAGERHLAGANAVLSTVRQIMTFVGPLLGVAIAAWSPAAGFAVNAATFSRSSTGPLGRPSNGSPPGWSRRIWTPDPMSCARNRPVGGAAAHGDGDDHRSDDALADSR